MSGYPEITKGVDLKNFLGCLGLTVMVYGCVANAPAEAEGAQAMQDKKIMTWNDLLSREQPSPDETISYGDDPLQVIDIWRPAKVVSAPAVIMIHGGCWQTSVAERDIMNWIADDLRKHGVGVWNIEYRGVDRGGGYPGTYEDVGKAADLFEKRAAEFGMQTSRKIAIGHSAGGHLALWLVNRPKFMVTEKLRGDDPIRLDLAISQGGLPDLREGGLRHGHPCGTDAPQKMSGPDFSLTSPPEMNVGEAKQILFNNDSDHVAPPEYARTYKAKMAAKNTAVFIDETDGEGHVELIAPDSKSWAKQRDVILKEFRLK